MHASGEQLTLAFAGAVGNGVRRVMKNPIPLLRKIAFAEGISFLVLLGVAMPLKYFAGMPLAVKIVGWLHGVLFIALCVALLRAMLIAKWPVSRGALIFIAALLPFGPFVVDGRMAAWEREFVANRGSTGDGGERGVSESGAASSP